MIGCGVYSCDFSDWNSPITVSYTVSSTRDRKHIYTDHESATIPPTGNSDVGAVASSTDYGATEERTWYWGQYMEKAELEKGPARWPHANIKPANGFNIVETETKKRQ